MPIYEYQCRKCGSIVEKIQKFSDPPLKKHPDCGGTLTKLVSQSSFQLKGSGWYVTDYARKDAKGAEAGNGDKAATAEGEKKTESKGSESGTDSGDGGKKKTSEKKPSGGAKK